MVELLHIHVIPMKFNVSLTNDIINFEQLGPECIEFESVG